VQYVHQVRLVRLVLLPLLCLPHACRCKALYAELHDVITTKWGIPLLLETEVEALRAARQEGGHHLGLQEAAAAAMDKGALVFEACEYMPMAISSILLEEGQQDLRCDHKGAAGSSNDSPALQQEAAASGSSQRQAGSNNATTAQQQHQQSADASHGGTVAIEDKLCLQSKQMRVADAAGCDDRIVPLQLPMTHKHGMHRQNSGHNKRCCCTVTQLLLAITLTRV
jgi:hypothetical protein